MRSLRQDESPDIAPASRAPSRPSIAGRGRLTGGRAARMFRGMTNRAEKAAFSLVAELAVGGASSEEAFRKFGILGEHAVPALRDALDLAERPMVLLAAQALARIESRTVIAPLLNLAHTRRERDPEIVTFALRGVAANLRPEDTDRVLPFALEFREHADPFVRAALASVLGALEPERTHQELAMLAQDHDRFVAETAAAQIRLQGEGGDDLVGRLGDMRGEVRLDAIADLLARDDADDVILLHLDTSLPKLRRTLLEAAAQRKSEGLATRLIDAIDAPETSDHDRALCLRGVVSARAISLDALGRTAHHFSQVADVFVRAEAFAMGIRCGVPHADELIDRALRDPEEHVQEVAAAAHATANPDHPPREPARDPAPQSTSGPERESEPASTTPVPDAAAPAPTDEDPTPAELPVESGSDELPVNPAHSSVHRDHSTPPARTQQESGVIASARSEQHTSESFSAFAARESHVVPKDAPNASETDASASDDDTKRNAPNELDS
ncbi:MAG: HEAT repeat protein [Flavobacteriales bacterium]|jgi:HEAT repeat protein